MKRIIKVPEGLSDYIESLQYESDRTREIMAFMLSHPGYDVKMDTFQMWEKENRKAYSELRIAKDKLEHEVIRPVLKAGEKLQGWTLDFYTHEVTVEVADAQKN